jgi:lipoic acid synthetase
MKRPDWIRASVSFGNRSEKFRKVLGSSSLNTVCVEADCPNRGECWESGSATFIILGDVCTRDCIFCNVKKGIPLDAEAEEPLNIARTINELGIKYAVITSVTRDDIADAGAKHFVKTVAAIKDNCPLVPVELLIPDFSARPELLKEVSLSGAEVIGHNIEMPETLYTFLRPSASYYNSLNVLKQLVSLKTTGRVFFVKSSIMLGLGRRSLIF